MNISPVDIYAVGITTLLLIFLGLMLWLGKPLKQLIMRRLSPAKYTIIRNVFANGAFEDEIKVNPKKAKGISDEEYAKEYQKELGVNIVDKYHWERATGVAIHVCFEGEQTNRNLLKEYKPVIDSKLMNQTIVHGIQTGRLDALTEMQKKDSLFTIQNVIAIVLILAVCIMVALTVQNQDILKQIATQTAAPIVSRVVAG